TDTADTLEGEAFDLSNLGLTEGLYDLYARLIEEAPVYWSPRLGGWYVSSYPLVLETFRDRRLSANRLTPAFESMPEEPRQLTQPLADSLGRWTLLLDPPDHTRMRSLIVKAFTPRLIQAFEPKVESLVRRLVAPGLERGEMDVIAELAYPLPATVIAMMMGVPAEDIDRIKGWSSTIAEFFGLPSYTLDKVLETQRAVVEMTDYFRERVKEHIREPRDDLISRLIDAREEGDVLDDDELLATMVMLVFAGHETTTNLIANAVLTLHDHPRALAALRSDPARTAAAVEEVLRFESPVQRLSRMAAATFELGGREIRAGQRVFLLIGAANRDPEAFPQPGRFDIERTGNRHLGFGWGAHYCIGAALGRLEARIALEHLVGRLGEYELAEPPRWHASSALRALERLPIRFQAG
ncbi:MAG: cytochrome P450, partial [Holophagales bacterium]|nr:cytochrome P450 [Holophagales bacterium]